MKKVVFKNSEFIVGEGYALLRVWRKLRRTCWTSFTEVPKINPSRNYALRVIPAGEGQSQDWPEVEWFTASQLIAMLADL